LLLIWEYPPRVIHSPWVKIFVINVFSTGLHHIDGVYPDLWIEMVVFANGTV
jgi:hypothetical protein